jgi:hypothetical protein
MSLERSDNTISFSYTINNNNTNNDENNNNNNHDDDDNNLIEELCKAIELAERSKAAAVERFEAEKEKKRINKKIKDYLISNYDPEDIIKKCMQIGVSDTGNIDKYNLIDINNCITKNELIIIMYKTGDVYKMKITPTLTFQCIVDYILEETNEFIGNTEEDEQYSLILDERSICDLYPTTEQFLNTQIESNIPPIAKEKLNK